MMIPISFKSCYTRKSFYLAHLTLTVWMSGLLNEDTNLASETSVYMHLFQDTMKVEQSPHENTVIQGYVIKSKLLKIIFKKKLQPYLSCVRPLVNTLSVNPRKQYLFLYLSQ